MGALYPVWANVSGVCDVPAARWCETGGWEAREERGELKRWSQQKSLKCPQSMTESVKAGELS